MSERAGLVVVGCDGSPAAQCAVLWAATEAVAAGVPLHVVVVREPDVSGWRGSPVGHGQAGAERVLQRAVTAAKAVVSGRVPITSRVRSGHPASVLLEEAAPAGAWPGARVLVLGTRGHLGPLGALLGSVARDVVSRSQQPVVLLGPQTRVAPTSRVVTTCPEGYAEGPAVEWALGQALTRRVELLLLDTWQPRPLAPGVAWSEAVVAAHQEALERHVRALDELRRRAGGQVPVTGRLLSGAAEDVEYAVTGAGDLLVVSAADHRHRPSLRHERCPVALVPEQVLVADRLMERPVARAQATERVDVDLASPAMRSVCDG